MGSARKPHGRRTAWSPAGHDVRVLSASTDEWIVNEIQGQVKLRRLPPPDSKLELRSDAARWLAWSVEVACGLETMRNEQPFDLIEFPEWGSQAYVYLLNRPLDDQALAVIQLHGPMPLLAERIGWPASDSDLFRIGTHMEATCLRLADAVYSSSDISTASCAKAYGLDTRHVPTIHCGVDTRGFYPAERPVTEPIVAFVGRLVRNKGVEELLSALPHTRRAVPRSSAQALWPWRAHRDGAITQYGCRRRLSRSDRVS